MRAVDVIRTKRDGHALSAQQIAAFVEAATYRTWPDYQVAALLMAIVLRGMDAGETAHLTGSMVRSGVKLDWADLGAAVDKHSTGGVGDKTSFVLAPIAAACGALVPMISGRGLGHTGGTLDKLESVPGLRTALTLDEIRESVRRVGCVIASQTAEIAPADRALYALRDVTATVESIPLISASIMSKKIAEGIGSLVMDVKCGRGAFMKTLEQARELAQALVAIGRANGVTTEAMITGMDVPLGKTVGNALEIKESVEILKGGGPADVRELSLALAARMLRLAGVAKTLDEAERSANNALKSGKALETFRRMIVQQGGDASAIDDPARLPAASRQHLVRAERSGFAEGWHAELVGRAAVALGAGRDRADDTIDPAVGAVVLARPGDAVKQGDALLEIHYRDGERLGRALEILAGGCPISDEKPVAGPLILEVIE
jgi:pyrimidine-nucleoside phosphorylase